MSILKSELLCCAFALVGGCTEPGGADSGGDTGDGPEAHCTTDAEGWVTCDLTTWSTSLDAGDSPILDELDEGRCAVPYDDGYSGSLCAAAGALAHKGQTFGVESTGYSLDVASVLTILETYHVHINEEGGAGESIGSCPDTLRDSSVFQFLWCNHSSNHARTNMVYGMNKLQEEYQVQTGLDRADVGTWLGVALTDDETTSSDLDDLWFAVFWSNLHFGTTSTLRYTDDEGRLMTVVIRGLSVSAEWQASDAEAAGLRSEDIARDLSAFVADPLGDDPPETPVLRLRLGRIEFADWSSGGATWPGRSPSSIFVVNGAYTGDRPWHMAPRSGTDGDEDEDGESPLAIIDPVFEVEEAAGVAPSSVAVKDAGDELDALTAFVATAREESWKIAFGDAD